MSIIMENCLMCISRVCQDSFIFPCMTDSHSFHSNSLMGQYESRHSETPAAMTTCLCFLCSLWLSFVPSCSLWLSLFHQIDIQPWKMNKVASFRNLANYTQFLLTVSRVPQVLYDPPRQLNHPLSNTACHQPYPDGTFTDYRLIHFLI